jgi:hypothetical protein
MLDTEKLNVIMEKLDIVIEELDIIVNKLNGSNETIDDDMCEKYKDGPC